MTASIIKKLFSKIKCFLLPKHSADTDVSDKQKMSALLRLVLEQEPPIQTDEDDNGTVVRTFLESLNALSSYTDIDEAQLELLAEPNVSSSEDEENGIRKTESGAEDPDSQSQSAFFFGKPNTESEEGFLQLGGIKFSMEDDTFNVQAVAVESTSGLILLVSGARLS
jgi:hypothetical protein